MAGKRQVDFGFRIGAGAGSPSDDATLLLRLEVASDWVVLWTSKEHEEAGHPFILDREFSNEAGWHYQRIGNYADSRSAWNAMEEWFNGQATT